MCSQQVLNMFTSCSQCVPHQVLNMFTSCSQCVPHQVLNMFTLCSQCVPHQVLNMFTSCSQCVPHQVLNMFTSCSQCVPHQVLNVFKFSICSHQEHVFNVCDGQRKVAYYKTKKFELSDVALGQLISTTNNKHSHDHNLVMM